MDRIVFARNGADGCAGVQYTVVDKIDFACTDNMGLVRRLQ